MKKITLIISVIVSLTIWLLSPVIHILYSMLMEKYFDYKFLDIIENSGKFGDSFGVATSLFSLASFASALYILYKTNAFQQMKDRPYLATNLIDKTPNLKIKAESIEKVYIETKLSIKNYSDYLAHSIKITPKITTERKTITGNPVYILRPLGTTSQETPTMILGISLKDDLEILNNLSSNTETILQLEITYKNTTNKQFKSQNNYIVKLPQEHEPINEIRRKHFDPAKWGNFFVTCDLSEHSDFIKD